MLIVWPSPFRFREIKDLQCHTRHLATPGSCRSLVVLDREAWPEGARFSRGGTRCSLDKSESQKRCKADDHFAVLEVFGRRQVAAVRATLVEASSCSVAMPTRRRASTSSNLHRRAQDLAREHFRYSCCCTLNGNSDAHRRQQIVEGIRPAPAPAKDCQPEACASAGMSSRQLAQFDGVSRVLLCQNGFLVHLDYGHRCRQQQRDDR